ncbi:hypothetical protein C1884_04390 [Pseudomonas sp. GW460-R15]|nr:hypothetical protein C1887_04810 [Pseudomonas sp. GW456-R21]POA70599.1 hypothetical protein C1884_04390 [Pseudomonas sp. GW460-R15]
MGLGYLMKRRSATIKRRRIFFTLQACFPMRRCEYLWRGSLLPLGGEAAPYKATPSWQYHRVNKITAAAHPSGSKLPRHK